MADSSTPLGEAESAQGPARSEEAAASQSSHDSGAPLVRGLRVPEPPARPGAAPDFSHLVLGEAGGLGLVAADADRAAFLPYENDLLRVLDDDGAAQGPWQEYVTADERLKAYRAIVRTRAFDQRMLRAQRQGKTSFYIQCTGEEAISVGMAIAAKPGDLHFPTYRQQGILFANGADPESLMNQIFSNKKDPLRGKQLPIMYSDKDCDFFTISGNLATQWPQAVGWAMASAIAGDSKVAVAYVGDGASAEGDWHQGNLFASVYQPPVILCVVNNQWAISSTNAFAGADRNSFAARLGSYGIPSLRVDGNDALAVIAAGKLGAERARLGLGPLGIEFLTYRGSAHSTSDDPSKYRAKEELGNWPLGDPADRLRQHLILIGMLSEDEADAMDKEAEAEMREAEQRAEANGLMDTGGGADPAAMFDHVYAEIPEALALQKKEAGL